MANMVLRGVKKLPVKQGQKTGSKKRSLIIKKRLILV